MRLTSLAVLTGLALAVFPPALQAQTVTDNFDDNNDSGWEHYDPIHTAGFPVQATWSFPNGGYRLQTKVSPAPTVVGPGRAASLRPEIYTDFYVAVDLVNWDNSLDQAIGLLARMTDLGPGTTDGYAMTYQVPGHDIDITRIVNEGGPSVALNGEDSVTLVPGHSYRFVFIGKGNLLTARVYELPDTVNPIMEASGVDPDPSPHTTGKCGLIVFDNSDGTMVTDATYDNYFATDVEPPRLTLVDLNFGDYWITWPVDGPQYVLQASSSLPGTTWDDLTPTGTSAGTYYYEFTPSADPAHRFFRLVRR
jgi:hypothetical protein